jgi:Ca2+-transporting ATPase
MATHIVWVGLLMGGISIVTEAWAYETGHAHWQTMVFTVLCLSQMAHVLAIRSETESFFRQGALTNLPLFGAVFLTLGLQLATIYVPPLQSIFKTRTLSFPELITCLLLSSVVFWAVEIEKWYKRRNIQQNLLT